MLFKDINSPQCQNSLICRNRRPLGFFGLGVVLILAFIFIFVFYPGAQVILTVDHEQLSTEFEIKLDANITKPLNGLDILPARAIVFSLKESGEINEAVAKKTGKGQIVLPELIYSESIRDSTSVIALAYQQEAMDDLVDFKLSQVVADNKEAIIDEQSFTRIKVVTFKPNGRQAVVNVKVGRTVIPRLDLASLAKKMVNMPLEQAQTELAELSGVKEAKISQKGCWFKKMPLLSQRIVIGLDTF